MKGIFIFISRLLLVVLIGTFMSPGFAWQMIDSHSEQADISVVMGDAGHHEHHHHDNDGDDDDAAHGQIGHLLSHLPIVVSDIAPLLPAQESSAIFPGYARVFACTANDPPFKPPRNFLFV